MAQSSVTLYGLLDAYVSVGKGARGTQYLLESGGMSGSRLGFRGSEDLGGGLKAIFQIESGINIDTGTVGQGNTMWGRQAYVGLSSATLGTVSLGRQYNPQFVTVDAFDPFGTGFGSVANQGIFTLPNVRTNNSLVYKSPSLYGLTATAMGSLSEGTNVAPGVGNQGKSYDVDVTYAAGPLSIAGNYYHKFAVPTSSVAAQIWLAAASYDFGVAKISGEYQRVKNPSQLRNVRDDRDEWLIGAKIPLGAGVISVGGGQGWFRDVGGTTTTQYSAGYDYFLSKRTDVYVIGTYIDNSINTYTINGVTYNGPITSNGATGAGIAAVRDTTVKALAIGLRHRF